LVFQYRTCDREREDAGSPTSMWEREGGRVGCQLAAGRQASQRHGSRHTGRPVGMQLQAHVAGVVSRDKEVSVVGEGHCPHRGLVALDDCLELEGAAGQT
jgi:hypothetical protein